MSNATAKKWFDIQNVSETSADVYIYDYIGSYGVTASAFCALLQSLKVSTINVRINSGGGSVFDGSAIYNALMNHAAKVTIHVDGLAASMASVIAMAGDEIVMAKNAMMMIHRASSDVWGNAAVMRAEAVLLEKVDETILAAYVARTGGKPAAIKSAMEAETWMTADECLALGFCTSVAEAKTATASVDLSKFKNVPAALTANVDAKAPSKNMSNTTPVVAITPAIVATEPTAAESATRVAVEAAHAAHKIEIDSIRAAHATEIKELKSKLTESEKLSAANLGVKPVTTTPAASKDDVLTQYQALTGDAKSKFYAEHKDEIWAAHTNS